MADQAAWLLQWMDEYGVENVGDAWPTLLDDDAAQRIRDLAREARRPPGGLSVRGAGVVAGGALNLSGAMTCSSTTCTLQRVDELFARLWHYFDTIVVAGPTPLDLRSNFGLGPTAARSWLERQIAVLLHVRRLGLDDGLVFSPIPALCEEHWRQHAEEAGLLAVVDDADMMIEHIATSGELVVRDGPEGKEGLFKHPFFGEEDLGWRVAVLDAEEETLRRHVAESMYRSYSASLVSDLHKSRRLNLPLASTVRHVAQPQPTEAQVAMELEIPVLHGLPPQAAVELASDFPDELDAFRLRLRAAVS